MFMNMLLGMGGALPTVTVNVVSNLAGTFGFSAGFGSTVPAVYTRNGFVMDQSFSIPSSIDFRLHFNGYAGAQGDLFTSISVLDQAGSPRVFTAASATYGGGFWTWGAGASPVWTAGGVSRAITFT